MEKDFEVPGPLMMPPQIGFKDENGQYVYFTKDDLNYSPNLEIAKKLSQKQIKLLAPKDLLNDLITFAKEKGLEWKPDENGRFGLSEDALDDGKLKLDISGVIDLDLQRAIAKLALNYLTKVSGHEYVLGGRFDEIRDFINGGEDKKFVTPEHNTLLTTDTDNERSFGHIFIVEELNNNLVAKISLFNQGFAYIVDLTKDAGTSMNHYTSGHFYDPNRSEIFEIPHIRVFHSLK